MNTITISWEIDLLQTSVHQDKKLKVSMRFSYTKSEATKGIIEKDLSRIIYERILICFEKSKIKSMIQKYDINVLNQWIIKRTEKICGREYTIIESKCSIDNKLVSVINPKFSERTVVFKHSGNLVKRILQPFEIKKSFGNINSQLTSKKSWGIANRIMHTREITPFITLICPPYTKPCNDGSYSDYDGLSPNFEVDPLNYNFGYNYKLYFNALEKIKALFDKNKIEIRIKPIIVFGDWALVNINGVKKTLKNEKNIMETLGDFKKSMIKFCDKKYIDVEITSFQDIGVPKFLPIGFDENPRLLYKWVREKYKDGEINWLNSDIIKYCVENKIKLINYLDWRKYNELYLPVNIKSELIVFLKTFHNIVWIRARESLKKNAELENLDFSLILGDKFKKVRENAYYDALLRYLEYKLYGFLLAEKYGESICCYQDTTFTAVGLCLENNKFPVLFINPYKLNNE